LPEQPAVLKPPSRLDDLARRRPDVALMAPMLIYLLLLALRDLMPYDFRWVAALLRGGVGLWAVWAFRKGFPKWGRPHLVLSIVCALLIAAGWYYGQYFFDWLGLPHGLPPIASPDAEFPDPRAELAEAGGFWVGLFGLQTVFWLDVVTKIAVASITVPLVEELFWRAFLLRALIDWDHFERIPLGTFTWFSFLATALISTVEHPYNWAVSIPCWFAFNALLYWKKSVLFLVLTHGFTNLFLYIWVILSTVRCGNPNDWMFW